ncbi:hypothetical protein M501DRAFT_940292 [Patellaria atrata CBS 101060]|uniref:Zn(2)-C6 fungal-type domain-containing protein n=1 Tax=Patellaria atrata CBS 101060 TaxID=1346257 RepID=A0A9P4VQA7_9PEZI|nr:hypothetical protein M501DRAFT_940292 [Patellaria atrata CBS 101060]
MSNFTFANANMQPREGQRNYVFVDEHNRHKRLKVMRACEGCRRRKIKCDAATTNSWPCAACIRLKLHCVPPSINYEKDFNPTSQTFELGRNSEYETITGTADDYQRQLIAQQQLVSDTSPPLSHQQQVAYSDGARDFQTSSYVEGPQAHDVLAYSGIQPVQMPQQDLRYQSQPLYSAPSANSYTTTDHDGIWRPDVTPTSLSDAMGDLKISQDAVATYITNQKKTLEDSAAQEDFEFDVSTYTAPGQKVRIPPEMMPSNDRALEYFDYFFKNIHPYIPVLHRTIFYRQWHTDPDSISPLLLEAIFACCCVMLDNTPEADKFLALASKHEESFKDVPRLSTIQAMLLLMKARESRPKRGYFYRSWMSVVNAVAMAKDLELDEHYELHQETRLCGSSHFDCIVKSRVWHTLFVLEIMVGGPQGRYDFGVKLETVDFNPPSPMTQPVLDSAELPISRQFSYFLKIVQLIQHTTVMHGKLKKKNKAWPLDPKFVEHNQNYPGWLRNLPADLQIQYPNDGSAPFIESHFIANMHSYYHLGVIMHHRPQFHARSELNDLSWKQHMMVCYTSAKSLCRLQEAVIFKYGIDGLLCMLRGISFTVYCVLTCTMLHLVAITSPDPDINSDARDYFVRHMRILEQCTPSWPMSEMHDQVNALREAFSVDLSKPFELKPSFPYGSPGAPNHPSPPLSNDGTYRGRGSGQDLSLEQPGQVTYHAHPITPPISATDTDSKADSPAVQSLAMMSTGQRQPSSSSIQLQEPAQWNPTRIFDQWNVAFGTPPSSSTSQSSPPLRPPQPGSYGLSAQDQSLQTYPQQATVLPQTSQVQNLHAQLPPPVSYATPTNPYVTPSMWQDVVASSFGDGLKRRWDYGNHGIMDQGQMSKRPR